MAITKNTRCPFCKEKLKEGVESWNGFWVRKTGKFICMNSKCSIHGHSLEPEIWKKLITLQKKVDIAKQYLHEIEDCHFQGGEKSVKMGVQVLAGSALKQMKEVRA